MVGIHADILVLLFVLVGALIIEVVGVPLFRFARNAFNIQFFRNTEDALPSYGFMRRGSLGPQTKRLMEGEDD